MKILITGGTGFVGGFLSKYFIDRGIQVIATGTSREHPLSGSDLFEFVSSDTTVAGAWQDRVKDADAVVNLAGRNIFHYWTEAYKRKIYDSRVLTTRNIADALDDRRQTVFLSTSAIGYYGDRGDDVLHEGEDPGDDFLAGVCVDWEKEALRAEAKASRVVVMRFGVILGQKGGALSKMMPAFRFFAGGPLGSGRQWFPWMHIHDVAAAIEYILKNDAMQGPFNFCSPHPVRNSQFAKQLGAALKRPSFVKTPAFAIRLLMGEMGGAMLSSQRGSPQKLQQHGFEFRYPLLDKALENIIGSDR